MKSKDLVVGEHYAYSNQRAAYRTMKRVVIIEIGVEIRSGYYGKAHNGVLVKFLDEDGSERSAPIYTIPIVRPGSLHWLWEKEIEYKAARDAENAEYLASQQVRGIEVKALVKRVNRHLGVDVFVVRGNGKERRNSWRVSSNYDREELAKLIVTKIESK